MAQITAQDLQAMVSHWLHTPVCGYLGSDYGQDLKSLLQKPLNGLETDAFFQKMRSDIALLAVLPSSAVSCGVETRHPDKVFLTVNVAGQSIDIDVTELA